MKPKVFVTRKIPESGIKLLKQYCEVRIYPKNRVISRAELIRGVGWCDALLCLLTDRVDAKIMDVNPSIKVISNYAVGYDNIDINAATERKIPVTNTPDVLTDAVAEHTIALMLAIARRISESDMFIRNGKYKGWEPLLLLGHELKGKVLGVIGLGRIGYSVAEIAVKGMKMKALYYNTHRNPKFEKEFRGRYVNLNALLKQSDFVTLHVPLLDSTKHLIGAKELGMMKKTAYLINTSRGPVIDEKALVRALKDKKIAGAALDVYEFEPELADGLTKLNNVVLTPHTASATFEARSAMSELAAKNILAVLKNKKPLSIANPEALNKKTKIKAIGFDFDDTLIISEKEKAGIFEEIFYQKYKVKKGVKEAYKSLLGKANREEKIKRIIKKLLKREPSKKELKEISHAFSKGYESKLSLCPLVQCLNLLKELKKQVKFMFILSLENKKEVVKVANHCNVAGYFDEILGGPKSKLENLMHVLKKHNVKPEETTYIGDSGEDIIQAKKLKIKTIGLQKKISYRLILKKLGADFTFSSLCEVPFGKIIK